MGTKRGEERVDGPRQDGDARETQAPSSHAAVAEVHELIARGNADPQSIALVIQRQPAAREPIYAHLHQVLGNQFVVQVEAALAVMPVAVPLPGGGKGTAPKTPPPSGSPQAMTELQDEIAKGVPHPERIPMLAAMLGYDDRVSVRDTQLASFDSKLSAAQTIAVYEALGQTTLDTARAAVRRGANARDLARFIGPLDADSLVELGEDPDLLRSIRAGLPGALLQYTQITVGWPQVAQSGPLIRWFIESSTPQQIWREIAGAGSKPDLVATLESEQLWGWVSSLSPHGMTVYDAGSLRDIIALAPAGIKPTFEALAAAAPAPRASNPDATEAELDESNKKLEKEQKDAGAKLLKKLSSSEAVTADEIMDGVAAAQFGAHTIGNDDRARRKVVAALDVEQLSKFVYMAGFSPGQKLDWLLDKKGVTSSYLMEVLRGGSGLESVLGDDARTKRVADRLGDDFDLGSMVTIDGKLQKAALSHQPLRSLLLGKQPTSRQLLRFVMADASADSVVTACKSVAKDVGYGWVYDLTNEAEDEEQLRRLAMACPDHGAREHLAKFGIHAWALEKQPTVQSPVASEPSVYQTEEQHLKDDVASNQADVAADAIEMSADARAAMRKDRTQANAAISAAADGSNMGMDAVRTARELDGTLPETIRDITGQDEYIDHSGFRTYARERPASEQLEVAGDKKLAVLAEKLLGYSPLGALPALRSPAALGQALSTNPGLLAWIERTTSPLEVLELLGANTGNAKTAARIMESTKSFALIKSLPHKGLTVDQRAALARLGAEATGQQLHEAVGDRLTENADSDSAKGPPTKPDGGKPLGGVLDDLIQRGASGKEIQAACSAHPLSEAKEVLVGGNPAHLDALRALWVSPLTIFPALAAESADFLYASTIGLTDWLLATEESLAVLRTIAGSPKAVRYVALAIDTNKLGARHFLNFLPDGHGLAEADEAALLEIYSALTSDAAALRVFSTRFGHAPEGDWSRVALDKMWATLSRLPDRQVEANLKFGGLSRGDGTEDAQLGGKYTPGTGVVTIKADDEEKEKRYEDGKWQTKELLAKQLGVDDAEIDRRVGAQRIEKQLIKGAEVFRVKVVEDSKFTYTLLHEIGHAVDALLGSRTDLVYGIGGWKVYGGGEFDGWASEMGGWQGGLDG